MLTKILHHTASPVTLMDPKAYFDAREQPVAEDKYARLPTEAEIAQAQADNAAERKALAFPAPLVSTPPNPFLLALRSELPAQTCGVCGKPNAYHVDTSGAHWIGCAGVPARERITQMVGRPLTFTEQYGDPHPGVSRAIGDALLAACGEEVSAFYDELSWSERLNLARRLAEISVIALRAEDAKWQR